MINNIILFEISYYIKYINKYILLMKYKNINSIKNNRN